jgi:TatD DNase family protein
MAWIDQHCHLADDTAEAQLDEAMAAGVERVVDVGVDRASSEAALRRAEAHAGVVATAGLHPHEAKNGLDGLEELLSSEGVVAVGECGLDYHYDNSPRADQRSVFATQIGWAGRHDLPLVIHTREAWDDTFGILEAEGVPERLVFHCFTGGPSEAERALALGAHLSFSGIVTFKSADDLRAAVAICPLDRTLVETDSPYLAPVPHRGRANRPSLVPIIGAAVAAAQNRTVAEVEIATWRNAISLYRLTL